MFLAIHSALRHVFACRISQEVFGSKTKSSSKQTAFLKGVLAAGQVVIKRFSKEQCKFNPCLNGGKCVPGKTACECPSGWMGKYCHSKVKDDFLMLSASQGAAGTFTRVATVGQWRRSANWCGPR